MRPAHSMLEPLERLETLLARRIGFISLQTPDRSSWYKWIPCSGLRQFAYQFLKHCDMAWSVLRDSRAEIYLVYEFNAPYVLPLILALVLRRRPSFLLMHGVLQLASRSLFHAFGCNVVRYFVRNYNSYAVFLELSDQSLDPGLRMPTGKSLVIPLPHPIAEIREPVIRKRPPGERIKIGVVGMLREGKRVRDLTAHLVRFAKSGRRSVDILFGTPFWQKQAWVDQLPIEVCDTGSADQYEAMLRDLDIFVCSFSEGEYFFRPSGVIGDALMNGCYVVCPDFPVFKAQIENPVRVGRAYSSMEDLFGVIELACDDLSSISVERFDEWRNYRKVENSAETFRLALQAQGIDDSETQQDVV